MEASCRIQMKFATDIHLIGVVDRVKDPTGMGIYGYGVVVNANMQFVMKAESVTVLDGAVVVV